MRRAYDSALEVLGSAHARLSALVPAPKAVVAFGHIAFRYVERTPEQALVLKTAAAISRLRASLVLLDSGYILEQGALHRMIDEANQDVLFLALALVKGKWTPHHDQFMTAFFSEEFSDAADIVSTRKRRNLVPRRKILAFIANAGETPNPHRDIEVSEALGGMYSGFVHGAAPHILDCYGGDPPHFHLAGMLGTPLIEAHVYDTWNYVFRTMQAMGVAAAAIGNEDLFDYMTQELELFQAGTGRTS